MPGQVVGYIRVSSVDQNLDRQQDSMDAAGAERVFTDKASGKDRKRPGLEDCMRYLRDGDTLIAHSIDRLARSLADLQDLVSELSGRGVTVSFIKEGLTFTPGSHGSAMDRLLFQVLGAFAEFERSLIRERQREGIAIAQAKGKRFGRPKALTTDQVAEAKERVAAGETPSSIARDLGVSRQTVWRAAKG